MNRLRLLHFDIKTFGNYGDTLLFESVREVFNGFAGGRCFEVSETRPLRESVSGSLIDYINADFDAVLIGGGGLFLRDTAPNVNSGWQWNISLKQLQRLKKPLIVFGVGNNRFIGQEDFAPVFREHVSLTLEKSVFFGLRNHGSIRTICDYVPAELRDRIAYQPCPTTLGSYLYPDLFDHEISDERRVAVEMIVGKRQLRAKFDAEEIYAGVTRVMSRLASEGWMIDGVAHARADLKYLEAASQAGLPFRRVNLFDDDRVLYKGVEYYANLPIIFGSRGHAQMVPFGMGSLPIAPMIHNKIAYFAEDIGKPEWAIDPRKLDFEERLYRTLNEVSEGRREFRAELAGVRAEMMKTTELNLAQIYEDLTGKTVEPFVEPYTPVARRLAEVSYREALARQRSDEKVRSLKRAARDLGATDRAEGFVKRALHASARLARRLRRRLDPE